MSAFRRFIALTGALATLSIGLAATSVGLLTTATAAGGGGCGGGGGGGGTPGPTQVFASHFSGLGAFAAFSSVSGTTETDIFISANRTTVTTGGSGTTSTDSAAVGITVFDTLTGITSVQGFGCIENPNFAIDETLRAAGLAPTSITVFDFNTNTSSTATVSADWTGVGEATRSSSVQIFHSGSFTFTSQFVGVFRLADATGSVTDPDLNVSFDGSAIDAQLSNIKAGGVNVCVGTSC